MYYSKKLYIAVGLIENFIKDTKMGVQISEEVLAKVKMTPDEFLIEMAVHFYDIGRMSMGQARNFANLDQISFQKEMSKRDVLIKYDIEDIEADLRTLEMMDLEKE